MERKGSEEELKGMRNRIEQEDERKGKRNKREKGEKRKKKEYLLKTTRLYILSINKIIDFVRPNN